MTDNEGLEILLEHLKLERGFDFTGYKRASLARRMAMRLEAVGCDSYAAYRDYLEVEPAEFPLLFNTILINVTAFFRDQPAWDHVAETVLPEILAGKGPNEAIRVWSAGCASGEETYTVAMLLIAALGESAYKDRVKIYATDVDDAALELARAAVYPAKAVEPVPDTLRERCFDPVDARYAFRKDLRRPIIFGRNDLVGDAPISRVDLLICRNTLMYFNAEAQARILGRFNFALRPDGFLFMGKSEMLITHGDLFRPTDVKARIFTKVPRGPVDRAFLARPRREAAPEFDSDVSRLSQLAFDGAPVAQMVVGADGDVAVANRAVRDLIGLEAGDVGRPLKDLEACYRPMDLRTPLDLVFTSGRSTMVEPVELTNGRGARRLVEVGVTPVLNGADVVAATLTFEDVTSRARLQEELASSQRELEHSYEELQSTVEELETTNEELQSTNEELETTNEELQSTNEELETMNEELQSTNEELETINDELRQRTEELDDVNIFLETILSSLGLGLVVVDAGLRVQVWNGQSAEMWGMPASEALGQPLLSLDIGLPLDEIKRPLREVVDGGTDRATLAVEAVNRRGKGVTCNVTIVPMNGHGGPEAGAVVLVEQSTPA